MAKRKRRAASGRFLPVAAAAPARKRKSAPRRAKRNPPRARRNSPLKHAALKKTLGTAAAAIMGGLLAHVAVKVSDKIASPAVGDVARVIVPALIGFGITQVRHQHAQAAAAGALGVAGAAAGGAIADAVAVRANPPIDPRAFWLDNPPSAERLTDSANAGYRDGVTAYLLSR